MLAFAAKGQVLWDEYMANTVPQSKSVEATLGMAWKECDFLASKTLIDRGFKIS